MGAAVTNGMRIVVLAVLGRLLTNTEFGIVAAAVSVNAIVFGIRDLGIGLALVQRKDLDQAHLTTAFATSTYLGIVLSGGLVIAAPYIGRAYGIVESVDVIRGLAVMFAIRSIATTSRMLAQRAMNFRLITIVDTIAFTAGSLASMIAAVLEAGSWSLVIGYLVEESLQALLYLRYSPTRLSLRIDRKRLRDLLSFGAGHSVVLAANLVATFGDNIIVGNQRGAKALGNYSRAYDLIKFPSMVFDAIVGNVLFPAFAKLQDDPANLGATFRRVTFVNSLVLLPASGALIVVAPEAIHVILGAGWTGAVIPFQILAVSIFFRTSLKLGGIVAQAAGAVNAVAIAYIIYMIVLVGGAAISIRWGVAGVATTTAGALILASLECSYLAIRVSRSSFASFFTAHAHGVILTVIVVGVTWPLTILLRSAALHPALVFGVIAITSMTICACCVWIWSVRGRGEFAWLGDELRRVLRRGRR